MLKHKKIKYIICDLSDVLIKGIEGVEESLSKTLGRNVDQIRDELFSYDFRPLWLGNKTEEDFFEELILHNNWHITKDEIKYLVRENFYEISGVRDIYSLLKKDYILILMSVIAKEWVEYLDKKFNYSGLFNHIFYSFTIGHTKRESESFRLVMDKLNISANNVLLIDDSLNNIKAAKEVDIESIHFVGVEDLKNLLINSHLLSCQ
jgi:FMN phosphatase YigB (HAD superfamily)